MALQHPFRSGLLALAKSALVTIAVPLALAELWRSLPPLGTVRPWMDTGLWIRVVIALVGIIWVLALRNLSRDLRAAFAGKPATTSWSARWAGSIAGLVLFLTSAHVLTPPRSSPQAAAAIAANHTATRHDTSIGAVGFLQPGECLADVAERHLGTRDGWVQLARLNYGLPQPDGGRLIDPDLVRSGWCLLLPGGSNSTDPQPAPRGVSDDRRRLEEQALLGLGVLTTAALVRRIRSLRGTARSARNFHERLGNPDAALADLDEMLAPLGDAPLLDWIDAANRLVSMVALRQQVQPSVRLVRAGPNGIVVYLQLPIDCDATPFAVEDAGRCWRLPLTASLQRVRALAAGYARWAPWLVPLGDDGDDAWLLALAPGCWLSLVGSPEITAQVLDGLLVAMRVLPWAEELQVELLGIQPPAPNERCYQLVASSPAVLAELLAEDRSARHDDSIAPWRRELMVAIGPDCEIPSSLLDARDRVAVISIGEDGTERLVIGEERCVLEPIGVELHVPRPSSAALAQIARLVDRAAAEPYYVEFEPSAQRPLRPKHEGIRLQLLGGEARAIGLNGLVAPLDEARVVELLAYLVLHDEGAARPRLEAALFPLGGGRAATRLNEILSVTRSALGARSPIPGPCLLLGEHIALTVTIASDWIDLLAALETARYAPVTEARTLLTTALKGEPRPPADPYRWMNSHELTSALRFAICDGWHQLGLLASAEGDLDAASAAARAGLRVEPTSELLVRDLMVVQDARHDAAGVLESYEELEEALIAIGGSEPALVTRQLFLQLTDRTPRSG